jgi:hypothetical protein
MSAVRLPSSPRVRSLAARLLLDLGLAVGGALAVVSFVVIARDNSGLGYDTPSYWLAARHVLDGLPLYTSDRYTTLGLYTYPPVFAQLFVPAALLPELLVSWLWRVSSVLCIRYITGSWKATVVAFVFIPVLTELSINNVTLQIAAALVWMMRDRRGVYVLPWVAALKFGPALVVPYLWFRRPETRRPLVIGTGLFAVACAASLALDPGAWGGYIDMLRFQNLTDLSGSQVIHVIPSGGGIDFIVRLALAGAVALLGAWWNRGWLAYAAASVTCPVMAVSRFAPLVGLWRFRPGGDPALADRAEAGSPAVAPPAGPAA